MGPCVRRDDIVGHPRAQGGRDQECDYPTGKSPRSLDFLSMSSPAARIFLFFRNRKSGYMHRHPVPLRGALRNVTSAGRGRRWTQAAPKTRARLLRTAKSCGPDTPTLVSSW